MNRRTSPLRSTALFLALALGACKSGDKGAPPENARAALTDPSLAKETAPATFKVKFATTKGDFVVEVHRDWAPKGADRFYNLVRIGYFSDVAFFRVVKSFMVQFGIHGDSTVNNAWRNARIDDDPASGHSNARGMITFATSGKDSRTTQLFINYKDNAQLDGMGFTPFGQVVTGMDVVDAIEGMYGEGAPMGQGPAQMLIQTQGNKYLKESFPKLDYVKTATVVD
jgi:peptidyl-prolyl cis-trans isomerase A (cyclophilin A)